MDPAMKEKINIVFGNIFREARLKNGLTQAGIAERLGISEKYISRIENGTDGVSNETLIKYMNILGITPNELYKEFINNEQVKAHIEFSESLDDLSADKINFLVSVIQLLKKLD